jgi:hypothetical protein
MKGLVKLLILSIFLVNCYGSDGDPGSTTFCKTIGKARKDEGCKRKLTFWEENIISVVAGATSRCSDPNALRDLRGNCFTENRYDLFQTIKIENGELKANVLNRSFISRAENLQIGSLCQDPNHTGVTSSGTHEQSIFSYDPKTRRAIQVLRYQDPSNPDNASITSQGSLNKKYLIPLEISNSFQPQWVVTFSGLLGICFNTGRGPNNLGAKNYYQILEVKE